MLAAMAEAQKDTFLRDWYKSDKAKVDAKRDKVDILCEPVYHAGIEACNDWVSFKNILHISVEYLGETKKERGVICASFNAG